VHCFSLLCLRWESRFLYKSKRYMQRHIAFPPRRQLVIDCTQRWSLAVSQVGRSRRRDRVCRFVLAAARANERTSDHRQEQCGRINWAGGSYRGVTIRAVIHEAALSRYRWIAVQDHNIQPLLSAAILLPRTEFVTDGPACRGASDTRGREGKR